METYSVWMVLGGAIIVALLYAANPTFGAAALAVLVAGALTNGFQKGTL